MSSKVNPRKLLEDIEENVVNLKRYSEENSPVNDDCSILHDFENRLEYILLFGFLDKTTLLGSKKSYWNYIYTCLSSFKRTQDGLNFVKSFSALKSAVGRGRAFIRFCLMQRCLADTLQICFMDKKVTKDFYGEISIPAQEKWWSVLVSSLYKLSDLSFDLNDGYSELDVSWPKFARKQFLSSDQKFSQKNSSSLSVHSFFSQDEKDVNVLLDSESIKSEPSAHSSSENFSVKEKTDKVIYEELFNENNCLKEEISLLKEEKLQLSMDMQNLHSGFMKLQELCSSLENKKMVCQQCESSISTSKIVVCDSISERVNNVKTNEEKCLSEDNDIKIVSNLGNITAKSATEQSHTSTYFLQNTFHIVELLKEMKTLIDDMEDVFQKSDVSLTVSYISCLKSIRNSIEEKITAVVNNSNESFNFTSVIEKYINCMKKFSLQQSNMVNMLQEKVDSSVKQNQNLYKKISVLKNLLRSYGFLKHMSEKDFEPKPILPVNEELHFSKPNSEFICDNLAHDPLLKRFIVPLLPVFNSLISQLSAINQKMSELHYGLDSSYELNENLISRVQDQELHLKGVTKELEDAQHLVAVLKKQHMKLQSAENILKYDLQEKRKLLTRLKQQLENTREDFNLVRIKNSKSEAEWKDLRKEFVLRHKQTSEESGFLDDKGFEDQSSENSELHCKYTFNEEFVDGKSSFESCEEVAELIEVPKNSRLELLEQQCHSLYSSLMKNSKRQQDIDKRLEIMCKNIEKSSNKIVSSDTLTNIQSFENNSESININSASEETSENMFTTDCFMNSPHTSSDIGSLNSDSSSYLPVISTHSDTPENFYSDSSTSEHCISCDYLSSNIRLAPVSEHYQETILVPDSDSTSGCACENKGNGDMLSFCDSVELSASSQVRRSSDTAVSHVDSLLFKKKDLEESLKKLEMNNESLSSDNARFFESDELLNQVASLEDEKQHLLSKIHALEENNFVLSSELGQTMQKLSSNKTAKENEVAAIQFQLNSEVLKYEKALEEFSDQSKGLESMKEKVSTQEHLIQALEEALKDIRMERESDKEQQWQDLEDIQLALEAREQECLSLSEDLEKSVSEIEAERIKNEILTCQLEELKAYSKKNKSSMEAELLHLQNDSRELRKRLVKLLKEKDILWKRSNHFHHIQKVKIDDRWMSDSEVTQCLNCKSNFSFLLRKHHCRLCGRIFCYACANHWLLTASSSKRIRACNECYAEHVQLKKDLRRGSDVPDVEEDSEDENINDMSFIPVSSSSFNSEMLANMNDSLISLPIILKQSTPHFSSAPDLRYLYKQDECSNSRNVVEEQFEVRVENGNVRNEKQNIILDECTLTILDEILCSPKLRMLSEISADEIEASDDGIREMFVVNSGEIIALSLLCKKCPITLKWSFISTEEAIPVVLAFADIKSYETRPVVCYHENKMEDEIKLYHPGSYVFYLDASHQNQEMKIEYHFCMKTIKDEESLVN